jgi:hypothetical protein
VIGAAGSEAYVTRLHGDIEVRQDSPNLATAKGYYRHALAVATGLGMRHEIAHCHLGLGKLYRRTDKRSVASPSPVI